MLIFIDYTMNQLQLSLSLEDFIPENHLVWVVNTVLDSLEQKSLYDRYKVAAVLMQQNAGYR